MQRQKLEVKSTVAGFRVEHVEAIPELRSEATIFKHKKTGAMLLHLYNDDPNNLFCICFRTPVHNDTGVPHILEHSVLAGSRKFPLKDPFKEMLKGSLQTFLNAITYPDKTMYPVSSQVEKDFFNLVDIYCDAVFYPLLSRSTFAQEGWHFDVEDLKKPVSIKGIVYNEMKGVFSDFRSHVARKTMSELFADTTYYFESGGEPEHITDLTHKQFRDFHSNFYHPSNSFIVIYGNIPSEKTLGFLQKQYLKDFERRKVDSVIKPQKLWKKPRQIQFDAPASKDDDGTASVILSWLFGDAVDPVTALLGRIFSHYLFDNESSPLRRALVDSKLGEDLDDMCGFDGDMIQGMFCAGLRKTKPEHAEAIRDLILDTLRKEVMEGLDEELLEGSIRQIEFRLREITDGGHFPYNLKLAERALRSWLYGGDPLVHLRFEKPLSFIKKKKKAGTGYFSSKMKELLIDNTHTLLSVVVASSEMGEQLGKKTTEQAATLSSKFTAKDKKRYHALTLKLLEEQKKPPSAKALAALPKLSRLDLPLENEKVPVAIESIDGITLYTHPLFTAGIVYLDVGFDLSVVPPALLPYFPLYSDLLTRCGAAGFSAQQMAKRISLSTGGINSGDVIVGRFNSADELVMKCFVHGKALPERVDEMLGILHDLFTGPALDDEKLLRDILLEMRNELTGSVIRSGHTFAVTHASARLSKSRALDEQLDGISQLRFLDNIIKRDAISEVVDVMRQLHDLIINRNRCMLSMTTENPQRYFSSLKDFCGKIPRSGVRDAEMPFTPQPGGQPCGIAINSSVNYVARAWNLGRMDPELMGSVYLLARNLSTGYLWDKVRVEGGAYGGMALMSTTHPVFACASYRDPNLARTLDAFTAGLEVMAKGMTQNEIEQSIIGAIGRLDQPRGPHSKGFDETIALLSNRSVESRQQFRDAVLNCSSTALAQRAQEILANTETAVTVVGSEKAFNDAEKDGITFKRETLLENGK